MSYDNFLGLMIALVITGYLVYALLAPERL